MYAPDAKQVDIYNETARPIVDFVLEGYNGMCRVFFCFEQEIENSFYLNNKIYYKVFLNIHMVIRKNFL